ncbi:GvpL/GvpF family gas vesicle protein [Kitasatospora sp. DSM 101779]|uniref:GvpL/GvpF family gas vesicle protein n=1 Tax=Kitasatospora sp. DSM 101779 TaxID=2853165 RepID=UPI0021DB70EB|nr:GvpL/GvpF family gas vesicle protein [Kitasatospora sp. DSM 101779]MCU7826940.1 GvpL/GvpF family gas vesicle protein [Kitasatospora sp. DSM 101779]
MSVYVYAITADTHPGGLGRLTGVGSPPEALRALAGSGLRAVVSRAPEGLRARRRDLVAHQEVVESLMSEGPVLPLRFGAVAEDDQEVLGVLREQVDAYRERLAALDGCAEHLVKASAEEDALLRQILRDSAEARRLNERTKQSPDPEPKIRLGELVAGEIQRRNRSAAAELIDELSPLAREVRENPPNGNDFVSGSFLVEEDRQDDFRAAAAELAERWGEDRALRVHGPLPPYSFVQ